MDTRLRRARLATATLAAILLAAGPAQAAGEHVGLAKAERVEFGTLPLPVILNGRLVNYVFVVLRLTTVPGPNPTQIKAREPYVRDRLLRMAYSQPFVVAGDPTRIDDRRLIAVVAAEAERLIGRGRITKVEIATETARRRTGLTPPPPGRPIIP